MASPLIIFISLYKDELSLVRVYQKQHVPINVNDSRMDKRINNCSEFFRITIILVQKSYYVSSAGNWEFDCENSQLTCSELYRKGIHKNHRRRTTLILVIFSSTFSEFQWVHAAEEDHCGRFRKLEPKKMMLLLLPMGFYFSNLLTKIASVK